MIWILGRTNRMYRNKDFEESKKYIARRNEIITNRLLILFGIAVVTVACFVYFMSMSLSDSVKLRGISLVFMIILGILLICSVIFMYRRYKKDVDESDKTVHSKNVFGIILFLFLANLLIFFTYYKWIPFLTALSISLTILIYIFYLYQREFFIFSVFAAAGCFLIYFAETHSLASSYTFVFKVLLAVLAVLTFAAAVMATKKRGFLIKENILHKNSKSFPFYILSVFFAGSAVILFLTLFNISVFWLIFANLVYFIIIGIYFTVKMIQK